MQARVSAAIVATMVGGWGGVASAHEFVCEKSVAVVGVANLAPVSVPVVDEFPATVEYTLKIINVHPTSESVALSVSDELLDDWLGGFEFDPAPPFAVPVGESAVMTVRATINDYQSCLEVAALDGKADQFIDNILNVGWDHGSTQCGARLECVCPKGDESCTPPEGGVTRTQGFYATHPKALAECLKDEPIVMGYLTIPVDGVSTAQGLLWADIAKYADGSHRSEYDRDWVKLASQTLTAICTERIFGTVAPNGLVDSALEALNGGTCADMAELQTEVDDFNNSNDVASSLDDNFNPADPPNPRPPDPTVETAGTCNPPECSVSGGGALAMLAVGSALTMLRRRRRS